MARDLSAPRFAHLKKMATRLGKELPSETHARCLDIVARLDGFADWRAAKSAAERFASTPDIVGQRPEAPGTRWSEPGFIERLVSEMRAEFRRTGREALYLGETVGGDGSPLLMTPSHTLLVGKTAAGKTETAKGMVAALALAFPGSQFFFADGKGAPDWDEMAKRLSSLPVAKPERGGSFEELVDCVWREYRRRRDKFEEARLAGKGCSTIADYRWSVGPMPGAWLIMDETWPLFADLNFEAKWRTDGTTANKLKRLAAEAGSFGIHLLMTSQRFQVTNVPSVLRSNLGLQLVHALQASDAPFLQAPEAAELKAGSFFVSTQEFDGASAFMETHAGKVRVSMPPLGAVGKALGGS